MQNRVMGTLDLRGGCLLVCGGFDPRGLAVWLDGDDESMGDVVAVSVSPSWYKVAVSLAWRCRRGLDLAAVGAKSLPERWPPTQGSRLGLKHNVDSVFQPMRIK